MTTLLVQHLQGLAHDDAISSILITGSGRAFCAGGDLGWAAAYPGGPASGLHVLASQLHQAVLEIHRTGKPVIAAVNGVAAGAGFSLALACDFRILDQAATLRQAYTSAGLSIDGGGTFMLPRLAGLARALEIAAFDEPIDAQHAASTGLATRIARAGEAVDDARALASKLEARSQTSFALSKRLLRRSTETPPGGPARTRASRHRRLRPQRRGRRRHQRLHRKAHTRLPAGPNNGAGPGSVEPGDQRTDLPASITRGLVHQQPHSYRQNRMVHQ
jgi:2-(1,2-epoxy-1,2-dihydrophenyl)acetyl-CoA isomerase